MARKRKPFQQKRKAPAPYRRGRQDTFYVPDDLRRAITDVARARGNISRSELVCSILAADPEIAAQLALYEALQDMPTDQDQMGLWGSDQDQERTPNQREQLPLDTGPAPDRESPDGGATRKSDQDQGHEQDQTDAGLDGERSRLALARG